MKTYEVTITKAGTIRIEAEDEYQAEEMAREMEAEAWFEMNIDVNVEELK